MFARRLVAFALALLMLCSALLVPPRLLAAAPPALSLPIPPGETWKIIQGYNCGTHAAYDKNAIDLVNASGRTRGAPVLAAADGTLWWWGARGGSLILSHGNGYYTMYSHLEGRVPFAKGEFIPRGTVIGYAGSVNAGPNNPHLHFELFHGVGVSASNRTTIPLSFVEGYNLPNTGKCNEHMNVRLTASGGVADVEPPTTPALLDPGSGANQIVRWTAATDAGSGVKGYQVYVGSQPDGTGEWFVSDPEIALPTLDPGRYVVRVRALDNAGNASPWTTLLAVDL